MKLSAWIVIAGLTTSAVPAMGANTWIGVNGGIGLPMGDFADVAGTGFGIGASLDARVAPMWTLGGELGWSTFGGDSDFEDVLSAFAGENVDVSFTVIPITAVAKLMLNEGGSATPFLRAGIGAYMTTAKIEGDTFSTDDNTTDLGFNLGGGFTARSGENMRIGGDALFHYIATEGESTNLITVRLLLLFGVGGP